MLGLHGLSGKDEIFFLYYCTSCIILNTSSCLKVIKKHTEKNMFI